MTPQTRPLLAGFATALLLSGPLVSWCPLMRCPLSQCLAQEAEVAFRVDVVGGTAGSFDPDGTRHWSIDVPSTPPPCVPVELHVTLVSTMGDCVAEPELCSGIERSYEDYEGCGRGTLRCSDGEDNDGDGLIDDFDPECKGVRFWRFSLDADEGFTLESLTTEGTVADFFLVGETGRGDGCMFNKTDPVPPSSNGGRWGAVSAVGLTLGTPGIALDPVGEFVVLKLKGTLATDALPCRVRVMRPDEQGLAVCCDPQRTEVYDTNDVLVSVEVTDTVIELMPSEETPASFRRGDTDNNGEPAIGDGIALLTFLFLGGPELPCQDAADTDDSGVLELTDAVALFEYLFLGAARPAAPGPFACGLDPTKDALGCRTYTSCPGSCDPFTAPPGTLQLCLSEMLAGGFGETAVGDFDGDASLDILTESSGGAGLSLALNRGDGTFFPGIEIFLPFSVRSLAVGDLDGDGISDVVAASLQDSTVLVGLGNGFFADAGSLGAIESIRAVALADFDGDLALDVVATTLDGEIAFLSGLGDGTFATASLQRPVTSARSSSIATGDLNGDGAPEVVTVLRGREGFNDRAWVLLNRGDGTFQEAVEYDMGVSPRSVSLGDVDGDGLLDVVVGHVTANGNRRRDAILVRRGLGDGTLAEDWSKTFGTIDALCGFPCGGEGTVALGDFNNDGRADAVVRNTHGHQIGIFLGQADGTFEVPTIFRQPVGFGSFTVDDVRGDGRPDVVSGPAVFFLCDAE